ncbi:TPA: phage tail protein [Streptococcus suis]|nr:phage tail protein [Streptococcus suis]
MLLTIHDASLRKVAFIDNDKQATLNYFNDTWTRYLETGSSTFDFTVFKKAIISDVGRKRAYNYLNEKAFVSFQYKGKTYLHTIRKIEENEQVIKCYGINLNLELINEYANPYKAPKAMTFKEYCDAMDLLNFTFLKIGVNEILPQKISAEWEGTDTKLNRLLSLAKKFGAEIEFDTHLNADSSIKSFVVNVYHENDDKHQGVGRVSPTILKYGKNLKALTRTVDKTNVYNMIRPTGKDDQGNTVTISGLGAWSVNNSKGEREFYQAGEGLYAPLSMQMYPAAFTSGTMGDQWIRKDMTVESSNPEVIRSTAYRELKKNCYPAVTYEAEGFADLEIGDTVQVYDDGFSPVLLLEMRVSEQTISFTNPKNNKTTFSNAKALENLLSQGIQERLDRMIEDAKPYTVKVSTNNGTAFKNGQGQSVVTPTLMKGNRVINSGWRWVVNGEIKATSPTYIVKAADINQTMVLTIAAWIDNQEVASEQITFLNASDGPKGDKGEPGNDGVAGRDGQTPVVHWAYSDNADGTGLITSDNGQRYIGHYSDYTQADSTDKTKYRWADRWAKIEVGGRNLFKGSRDFSGVWFNNGNGVFFEEYKGVHIHRTKTAWLGKSQSIYVKSGEIYTFSFYAKSDSENDAVMFYLSHSATGTPAQGHPNNKNIGISTDYQRYSITIKIASDGIIVPRLERTNTTSFLFFGGFKLETGTLATDWSPAPEDLQNQLNSKADQALTQEQLNSLNERAQILDAELKAKASMDALSDLEKAYQSFVKSNADSRAKAEADLTEAGRRIEMLVTQFGGFKELKTFIDTYMSSSNEGLIIGKNDTSSTIKVSSDRISMFSAGKEVMYISQGVIHIDNGIFTASVQIGRFRTEQYHLDANINVIRYVG